MATGISSSYERHLNCSICMEVFDDPRALPCLHTFCEPCLRDFITSLSRKQNINSGFECPVCRTNTLPLATEADIKNWASSFPSNYVVKSLLDEVWCSATRSPVSKTALEGEENPSSTTRSFDPCDLHPEKTVDFFCEDHHVLCCSLCAALYHKPCLHIVYLLDKKSVTSNGEAGVVAPTDYQSPQHVKSHKPLSRLSRPRLESSLSLDLQHDMVFEEPAHMLPSPLARSDVVAGASQHLPLRRIPAQSIEDVHYLPDDSTNLDVNIEMAPEPLRNSPGQHDNTNIKQKRRISSGSDTFDQQQITVTGRGARPKQHIRRVGRVGSARFSASDLEITDLGNSRMDLNSKGKFDVCVSCFRDINVVIPEDAKPCNITGITRLSNGDVLLADHSNNRVKLMDSNNGCKGQLTFRSPPWDVATVGDMEAVVSLPEEMRLQLLLLGACVLPTRQIQMDRKCYGVCYCNQQFFVSLQTEVRILSYKGDIVKKIGGKGNFLVRHPKKAVFSNVLYLAIDSTGQKIYVSDNSKSWVLSVNRAGHTMETCSTSSKQRTLGLAVGPFESLFVGHAPGDLTLVQFGTEGTSEKNLISLGNVQAVHYSPACNNIYVSRTTSDIISIGHVEMKQKMYG